MDEVHRFNKAQQDAFLPYIEDGTFIFIGATTENPSFTLNNALLSRAPVQCLHPLDEVALETLLKRANNYVKIPEISDHAKKTLMDAASGDGRYLLGMVEALAHTNQKKIDDDALGKIIGKRAALYDKNGDGHYDMISVLHKAVRGSDVDAALFWLARMLTSGEDPLYIARRLVRMAVEDISLADPQAVVQAETAAAVYTRLGSPEGELALAQATAYLALAPKSNALYSGFKHVMQDAETHAEKMPPLFARNAPTKLMKQTGYGEGYQYDHNHPKGCSGQNYFPEGMARQQYYTPVNRGYERTLRDYISFYRKCREERPCN